MSFTHTSWWPRLLCFFMISMIMFCGINTSVKAQSTDPAPISIKSENFTLIGKIDPEKARGLINELEKFRLAMRDIYSAKTNDKDAHIHIYYITEKDVFAELSPTKTTSAFYYNSLSGPEIVLNGSLSAYDPKWTQHDLFHEYMHHFNRHYLDYNIPTWLNEGLAEYYAQTHDLGNGYVTGQVIGEHLAILRAGHWGDIEKLFDTLHGYPFPNGVAAHFGSRYPDAQSQFYAQSWLIVHYLMQDPSNLEKLRRFIGSLDPVMPNEPAFTEEFNLTYSEFIERLKHYASENILTERYIQGQPAQSSPQASPPAFLTPSRYKSELYLLMSKAAESYHSGQAQRRIETELADESLPVQAHMARASTAYFDGDYEKAAAHIAKAEKSQTLPPRLSNLAAVIEFYIWQAHMNPREDYKAGTVRTDLRRAIALNPDHLDLQLMFVSTFNPVREEMSPEIRQMVDTLLTRNYPVKNPDNALALITPLQDMRRYEDIYDIIDIGETWIRNPNLRNRTRSMRFRLEMDELRHE